MMMQLFKMRQHIVDIIRTAMLMRMMMRDDDADDDADS